MLHGLLSERPRVRVAPGTPNPRNLYTNDGVEILTGGSINGSLPEKQGNLRFSVERYDTMNYTGPYAVRINGVEVAG